MQEKSLGFIMTTKEKHMHRLYQARTTHLKWVNTIKLVVSGFEIDGKAFTPILQDSAFGKWFYHEAMPFAQFNSKNVLDEMETILETMYDHFTNIYAIYFTERQSSFKSFWGFKNGANKYESELASRSYDDIVKLSDQFKNRFNVFESQLLALSEEKHEMIKLFANEDEKIENTLTSSDDDVSSRYYGPRSH